MCTSPACLLYEHVAECFVSDDVNLDVDGIVECYEHVDYGPKIDKEISAESLIDRHHFH